MCERNCPECIPYVVSEFAGKSGDQGPANTVDDDDPGVQGPVGLDGYPGGHGNIGATGDKGEKGAIGQDGPQGAMGATGQEGPIAELPGPSFTASYNGFTTQGVALPPRTFTAAELEAGIDPFLGNDITWFTTKTLGVDDFSIDTTTNTITNDQPTTGMYKFTYTFIINVPTLDVGEAGYMMASIVDNDVPMETSSSTFLAYEPDGATLMTVMCSFVTAFTTLSSFRLRAVHPSNPPPPVAGGVLEAASLNGRWVA